MKTLFAKINKCIEKKRAFALVSIAKSYGSTPRREGAHMLITDEGPVLGTIGGGAVEYQAILLAQEVLKTKTGMIKQFRLAPNQENDIGMICGGDIDLLIQYFALEENPAIGEVVAAALHSIMHHETSYLLFQMTKVATSKLFFYSEETGVVGGDLALTRKTLRPGILELSGEMFYLEKLVSAERVIIFGAGHVSQALVPVLASVGFYCIVFDDRAEFLTKEVFPDADEMIQGDFNHIDHYLEIQAIDYCCVTTKGHKTDLVVEKQLLDTNSHYIGVMGSKRKITTHQKILKESGIPKEQIDRLIAPIGIEIHAETPNEIAISIAAELINRRSEMAKKAVLEVKEIT
ncbi:XdhC family protein [Listeria sp. PSOL-1]|uniref:XdhC family protein n=1 Tax=Listeria sp. PSOL-1 TaxID=1844999 RepID=UPI0013D7CA00|nr:XdhC/CoxI family protein [Listeria sp. PSOL-1]